MWITQDGGRTWIRRGEDADRMSPFDVDLGGEGTFGLCLVARSASGLGDQPPAPGDPPQSWGRGRFHGARRATLSAPDRHRPERGQGGDRLARPAICTCAQRRFAALAARRPGRAAWQPIMDGQENAGQYVWTVPPSFPAKFHLRVEAVDSLGHHGTAETSDATPVIVDRSRPRSRIIGLDPNALAGDGPAARPLR